jgi:hypothetical protein
MMGHGRLPELNNGEAMLEFVRIFLFHSGVLTVDLGFTGFDR